MMVMQPSQHHHNKMSIRNNRSISLLLPVISTVYTIKEMIEKSSNKPENYLDSVSSGFEFVTL